MTPDSFSAAKLLFGVALSFAAASVYLNKKSDAWADRCLYFAYGTLAAEIDKYAIQTATHNFPDIVELGDAFQVRAEDWRVT